MGSIGLRRTELVTVVGPMWITTAGESRPHRWHRFDGRREGGGVERIEPMPFVPRMGEEIHAELREDEGRPSPTAIAIEKIREDERAKLVAWMREVGTGAFGAVADAIEARFSVGSQTGSEETKGGTGA